MSGRKKNELGPRAGSLNPAGQGGKRGAHLKAARSTAAALKRPGIVNEASPFALIGGRGDARGRGTLSARSLLSGGRLDVEMDDAAARRPLFDSLPALASAAAMLCASSAAAMPSGGAISREAAIDGEHHDVDMYISQPVSLRVDIDALIAGIADLESPLAAQNAAASTSVMAPPQPLRRPRLQTLSQDHDDASIMAPPQPSQRGSQPVSLRVDIDALIAGIADLESPLAAQDAAASTSVMAPPWPSRRTPRRLPLLADAVAAPAAASSAGISLTVSAVAAEIMRNAAGITRLCASMPAPAAAPAGVVMMMRQEDSRELERVRALAAARINPATRLSLSIVLLAAVHAAKLVRRDGANKLSMPTVRVDLAAANPNRARVFTRGEAGTACSGSGGGDVDMRMAGDSSGSLSENTIPLQPGGARAVSAAFAGGADAAVTPHEYSPTPARVPLNFRRKHFFCDELWFRQSNALLDAAIYVAFGAPADTMTDTGSTASSAGARAVVVRALAGSSLLSVVSAEHDIFESDAAGTIATSVSTFGVVGGVVVPRRVREGVTLAALDFDIFMEQRSAPRRCASHSHIICHPRTLSPRMRRRRRLGAIAARCARSRLCGCRRTRMLSATLARASLPIAHLSAATAASSANNLCRRRVIYYASSASSGTSSSAMPARGARRY